MVWKFQHLVICICLFVNRIFSFLDVVTLCRCAQVSRVRTLAYQYWWGFNCWSLGHLQLATAFQNQGDVNMKLVFYAIEFPFILVLCTHTHTRGSSLGVSLGLHKMMVLLVCPSLLLDTSTHPVWQERWWGCVLSLCMQSMQRFFGSLQSSLIVLQEESVASIDTYENQYGAVIQNTVEIGAKPAPFFWVSCRSPLRRSVGAIQCSL